jgi:hypothetical protein
MVKTTTLLKSLLFIEQLSWVKQYVLFSSWKDVKLLNTTHVNVNKLDSCKINKINEISGNKH